MTNTDSSAPIDPTKETTTTAGERKCHPIDPHCTWPDCGCGQPVVNRKNGTAEERLKDTEHALFEQLRILQESYRQAAQPIIDKIVYIKSLQPPEPIFISRTLDPLTAHWFQPTATPETPHE